MSNLNTPLLYNKVSIFLGISELKKLSVSSKDSSLDLVQLCENLPFFYTNISGSWDSESWLLVLVQWVCL